MSAQVSNQDGNIKLQRQQPRLRRTQQPEQISSSPMVQEPKFQTYLDRLPPQNIDAEEAILGGILLDPEAITRVMEILRPDAFYISGHQQIYKAMIALHAQGRPTDLMSLTAWLKDQNQLEKVGGQSRLAQLVDRTVSAVNIDQYAVLVMDKAIRRKMIQIGGEVAQMGYENDVPLEQILDLAEQKVFSITQDRPTQGLTSTSDILTDTFADIEGRATGMVMPGISCGFYDLDAMTQGFQRSDLIIAAARPSMGKTSFVLNIARNIAAFHKLPVAVYSLEMSKEQLVYRMLSSEVQVESGRLRAGRISQNEWEPLGHGISGLSQLPIFIDDTPNISVTEMRSKARRLQAESGGALGLIVIDYLQLMEGSGDNRVQELSKITRSLKGMARELNVPVIALSQLSRGVESRTNKRPMMSDLRECVTGDTLVVLADGRRVPIQELVGTTPEVISMDAKGKLVKAESDLVWAVGRKPIYELKTRSGKVLRATAKHRLYTLDGWQRLRELKPGNRVAIARHLPEPSNFEQWPDLRIALLGQLIGDGSYLKGCPMRYTTASEENSELVTQAATQEFGCTVKRYLGKGNWHQLLISGNGNRWHPTGVNQWLRELGIFGQRSAEKRVPAAAFCLSNRQVGLLLRHLWATDGCISVRSQGRGDHAVFFSTISEKLAHDVAALLLRLGIQATVRWQPSQCFSVSVQGSEQQKRFLDQVGAFGPRVKPAQALSERLSSVQANPNRDTLPQEVFQLIRTEMAQQQISHRQMAALRGTAYGGNAHFNFAPSRTVVANYAELLNSSLFADLATTDLFWDEIVSIEPAGEEMVYDLTVPGTASWLADGLVSHNSGAIEQDADLIMMLYREEYYDPDTPDRGIAEVIITKHRNGPVGTVRLLFEPQFTLFRNLAASRS